MIVCRLKPIRFEFALVKIVIGSPTIQSADIYGTIANDIQGHANWSFRSRTLRIQKLIWQSENKLMWFVKQIFRTTIYVQRLEFRYAPHECLTQRLIYAQCIARNWRRLTFGLFQTAIIGLRNLMNLFSFVSWMVNYHWWFEMDKKTGWNFSEDELD